LWKERAQGGALLAQARERALASIKLQGAEKEGRSRSIRLIGSIKMPQEMLQQFEQEAESACVSSEEEARVWSDESIVSEEGARVSSIVREEKARVSSEDNGACMSSIVQQGLIVEWRSKHSHRNDLEQKGQATWEMGSCQGGRMSSKGNALESSMEQMCMLNTIMQQVDKAVDAAINLLESVNVSANDTEDTSTCGSIPSLGVRSQDSSSCGSSVSGSANLPALGVRDNDSLSSGEGSLVSQDDLSVFSGEFTLSGTSVTLTTASHRPHFSVHMTNWKKKTSLSWNQ